MTTETTETTDRPGPAARIDPLTIANRLAARLAGATVIDYPSRTFATVVWTDPAPDADDPDAPTIREDGPGLLLTVDAAGKFTITVTRAPADVIDAVLSALDATTGNGPR